MVLCVKASPLNRTLVRVFLLNDKPSAPLKVGYMGDGNKGVSLTRTDMARFLLEQVTDERYSHQAPIISNIGKNLRMLLGLLFAAKINVFSAR